MRLPDDYPDLLVDELAPYGFEFDSVATDEDGETAVLFTADPDSFVRAHRGLGIEHSYPGAWPPDALRLWVCFDSHGDPIRVDFEIFDLLAWAASLDPELHDRLNVFDDPAAHAVAVGEAVGQVLESESERQKDILD